MADNELHQKLGEVIGTLNSIDKKVDKLDTRLDDQDERIRSVEKKSYFNSAVIAGIVSISVGMIKNKFGG